MENNETNISKSTETYNTTARMDSVDQVFDNFLKWTSLFLFLGVLMLNTTLIIMLIYSRKKTRMSFFVKNLAIADLAVGMFYLLPETIFVWFGVKWNRYVCYIYYGYFSMVAYYASTYAIVVLTLDRMYVVIRPVSSMAKGKKYRYGMGISSWIIGLLLGIQYAVHIKYGEYRCFHDIPYTTVILYFDIFFLLLVPVLVISICYTLIFITIRRREQKGVEIKYGNGRTHECTSNQTNKQKRIITKAKTRTIKLSLVVVIVYIVCWTPITVAAILDHYGILGVEPIETRIYKVLFVFAPINSLANPLVFMVLNRKMFKRKNPIIPGSTENSFMFSASMGTHQMNSVF